MLEDDLSYMKRALELAGRGAGLVSPNPMVGAVLVEGGEIVGEGFHRYDRLKHAESYAIAMAGERARGATLYCSLEPCCHHGRTPPCANALIEAGISRAVIAMTDPDGRVNGRGIEQLRAAGIEVDVGLCEHEASRLNEFYLKLVTRGRPFVHALLLSDAADAGEWEPSESFLSKATEYDAIVLGVDREINRLVTGLSLNRERHRPLIVAGDRPTLEGLDLPEGVPEGVIRELMLAGSDALSSPALESLARLQATSVLILPGALSPVDSRDFENVDKVTTFTSSEPGKIGDDLKLEEWTVERLGDHSEVSGYLRSDGSAQEL
jgi:pyrimidine deaminase RibD-like protein